MGIIVKFTLRNIKEHKFRTFLILISIMLSVGLFFGSLSVADALTGIVLDNIKSYVGTAEMIVHPGRNTDSYTLKMRDLGEDAALFEYQIGVSEMSAAFRNHDNKNEPISLKGFNLDDLSIMNPVRLSDSIDGSGTLDETLFKGKSVIIGKAFSEDEGLALGDTVKLQFSEEDMKLFKIVGIAENQGFFKKSAFGESETVMLAPRDTLSRYLGSPNLVNVVYVKTADDKQVDYAVERLEDIYKNMGVEKIITKSELDAEIRPIRIPFMFMLILVVLISSFIIFTSFKVITLERLPMLGTFRSIGATKKMTDAIMLTEAFIYGVVGSLAGCYAGHHLLNLLMQLMAGDIIIGGLTYPVENLFYAFAFGTLLSVGSALVPIIRVSRVPVKEILLNIIEGTKRKRPYLRYIFGGILAVLSVVLPIVFAEGMMSAVSGALGIVLLIGALVCFVPLVTDLLIYMTEGLFNAVFGNIGMLAVKNMRGNKSTYDNIVLLTIGLASMLTISVMGTAIQKDTMSEFDMQTYDIHVYAEGASQTTMQRILSIEGIRDSILYQEAWEVFKYQDDEKSFVQLLVGIDNERYLDYFNYDILGHDNDKEIIQDLFSGRKLILGTAIRDKYGLKEGQKIELDTGQGMRTYEIIGFVNTRSANGRIGITNRSVLKNDLKRGWGLRMAMKVVPGYPVDDLVTRIEKKLQNLDWYEVESIDKRKERYYEENGKVIMILSAFSSATALIGSIGVMNNFLVSFLARKKSLAIYASVGMSKKQKKSMIIIEAISGGLIGSVFGLVTAQLIIMRVSDLLGKIDIKLSMQIGVVSAIAGVLGSILVCLVSSISVLRRSRKVSIIEELRYE